MRKNPELIGTYIGFAHILRASVKLQFILGIRSHMDGVSLLPVYHTRYIYRLSGTVQRTVGKQVGLFLPPFRSHIHYTIVCAQPGDSHKVVPRRTHIVISAGPFRHFKRRPSLRICPVHVPQGIVCLRIVDIQLVGHYLRTRNRTSCQAVYGYKLMLPALYR